MLLLEAYSTISVRLRAQLMIIVGSLILFHFSNFKTQWCEVIVISALVIIETMKEMRKRFLENIICLGFKRYIIA